MLLNYKFLFLIYSNRNSAFDFLKNIVQKLFFLFDNASCIVTPAELKIMSDSLIFFKNTVRETFLVPFPNIKILSIFFCLRAFFTNSFIFFNLFLVPK